MGDNDLDTLRFPDVPRQTFNILKSFNAPQRTMHGNFFQASERIQMPSSLIPHSEKPFRFIESAAKLLCLIPPKMHPCRAL